MCRLRYEGGSELFGRAAGGLDGKHIFVSFSYEGDRVITMTTHNGRAWECVVPKYVHDPRGVGDNDYLCVTSDIRRLYDLLKKNPGLLLTYNERGEAFTVWFGIYNCQGGVKFNKRRRGSVGGKSLNKRGVAGSPGRSLSDLEKRVGSLKEDPWGSYRFRVEASILASEGFLREHCEPIRAFRTFRC